MMNRGISHIECILRYCKIIEFKGAAVLLAAAP